MASKGSDVAVKTESKPAPAAKPGAGMWQSFAALRDDIDRMFDSFMRGVPALGRRPGGLEPVWKLEPAFGLAVPAVDVAERDKAYEITAELPGLEPANVELSLSGDILTIKGEKQEEQEQKEKSYYVSERRYGAFQRCFELPQGVDRDKIDARFANGVLTITLPKTAQAVQERKKIAIQAQ